METLRIAANALRAHKLRSFLTLLGVIIGVMTVVTVVSIISGLNNYISEKVFQLNPDVYVVTQFGIITSREQFLEAVKRKKIDWSDYEARRASAAGRCEAVGAAQDTRAPVKRGAKRLDGRADPRRDGEHGRAQQPRSRGGPLLHRRPRSGTPRWWS